MTQSIQSGVTVAKNVVNVALRTGAVLTTLTAIPHVAELASRTFKAMINALPDSFSKPVNDKMTLVKGYLPVQASFDGKKTNTDIAMAAAKYLGLALVCVFAANKMGSAPVFYNNSVSTLGNFLVGRVDVIALAGKRFV